MTFIIGVQFFWGAKTKACERPFTDVGVSGRGSRCRGDLFLGSGRVATRVESAGVRWVLSVSGSHWETTERLG